MLGSASVIQAERRNITVNALAEWTQILEMEMILQAFTASDGRGQVHFRFVQQLSCLCFRGLIQQHGQSVFVKLCRSYGTAAHQAMEAAGYAPALLRFEQLVQGWLLIAQESVDAVPWDEMVDKPVEPLKAAVRALHVAGFVHGDLHGCNILMAASAVYPVHVEWAGLWGQQHTCHIEIQWPDSADAGRLVTESHDVWWLSNFDLM